MKAKKKRPSVDDRIREAYQVGWNKGHQDGEKDAQIKMQNALGIIQCTSECCQDPY